MKKVFILLIFAFAQSNFGQSAKPELISSSGGDLVATDQQISWSLGEVVTETYSEGNNVVLNQGFHQCRYVITSVLENEFTNLEIKAFPNPTTDYITVQISENNGEIDKYIISLLDFQGKLLLEFNPNSKNTQVNFKDFAAGSYILSVSGNNKTLNTFKIIKIK